VVEGVQVKSWQRQSDLGVATLATADGIVFEIAWLPTDRWADELGRVATCPATADERQRGAGVGRPALRAARRGRRGPAQWSWRLVPVLADHHSGAVVKSGRPVADADVAGLLQTLSRETRGRLRALAAHVGDSAPSVVGVVSWLLLSDGWHALETQSGGGSDTPSSGCVPSRRATWPARWPP
jgi:hypothetical protein